MICPKCNYENADDNKFCQNCGNKFDEIKSNIIVEQNPVETEVRNTEIPIVEQKSVNNKKGSKKKIVIPIIIAIVLLLFVGCYFLFFNKSSKDKKEDNNNDVVEGFSSKGESTAKN